jgi:chemotaxis protein histidine kinase CheA
MDEPKRQPETSAVEQSVGRAMRDTLPLVQHTATELSHAIEDLVSACGSRKPSNTLPPMLRAQMAASSLAAMLESLARLVTLATQSPKLSPAEELISHAVSLPSPEPARMPQLPLREIPTPMSSAAPAVIEMPAPASRVEEVTVEPERLEPAAAEPEPEAVEEVAETSAPAGAAAAEATPALQVAEEPAAAAAFALENLPAEQQELHRRANRHAKVSMQDIRLLRPKEVAQGREHQDLCARLRLDLDKARKEYVRRFQPILEHPVDYFHQWALEILAEGRPEALGEYPYPTPANRR